MKNCKLLRFFILCNCIILSGQMLSMDNNFRKSKFTINASGNATSIVSEGTMTLHVNHGGNTRNKQTEEAEKNNQTEDAKKNTSLQWEVAGQSIDDSGDVELEDIIPLGTFDKKKFRLKVAGLNNDQHFLKINVRNVSAGEEIVLKYITGAEKDYNILSYIRHFLTVTKDENTVGVSIPDLFSEKSRVLINLIKEIKQKEKYDLQFELNLLLPKNIKNPTFHFKNSTLEGTLANSKSCFRGKDCRFYIRGHSQNPYFYIINGSFNEGKECEAFSATGDVTVEAVNSHVCFGGDTNNKTKTTASGFSKGDSEIKLAANIINNIERIVSRKKNRRNI